MDNGGKPSVERKLPIFGRNKLNRLNFIEWQFPVAAVVRRRADSDGRAM